MSKASLAWVVVAALLGGCGPSQPATGQSTGSNSPTATITKRVVAAIRGTPASLSQQKTNRAVGNVPGLDAIEEMVHAGTVIADDQGNLRPQLAEFVPSIDNGLWRVFTDGRMETTFTIRQGARWHDGTLLTTDDLAFGTVVEQDRDLGVARNPTYDLIEALDVADSRTITVKWKRPFIEADAMFSYRVGLPLPKHLLESAYHDDKGSFFGLPYWTSDFVGAGPFRMREWVADSHVVLRASDQYVHGRPKVDEIEVRFITDPNTLMANLLAGAVDVTLGRLLLPVEQAQQVAAQWKDARLSGSFRSWYPIHTQFINSNPPVITDVRFRRALLRAIDRQQLSESLAAGQSPIAHTWISPDTAGRKEVEASVVRYDYDPRRAVQEIEGLGYRRGADGVFFDGAGQKLSVEIWTTTRSEIQPRIVLSVAEYWKQAGVDVEPVFIPPQRMGDREMRAQFPAFEMISGSNGVSPEEIRRMHSSAIPLPENRFQVTGNNARYRNDELDTLIDRYVTTVPRGDRMRTLADIARHRSDQLPSMGLFFEVDFTVVSGRVKNVMARGPLSSQAWNASDWALKE